MLVAIGTVSKPTKWIEIIDYDYGDDFTQYKNFSITNNQLDATLLPYEDAVNIVIPKVKEIFNDDFCTFYMGGIDEI